MSKKKKIAYLAQKDVKLHIRYFFTHKNCKKQEIKRFFFLDALWHFVLYFLDVFRHA